MRVKTDKAHSILLYQNNPERYNSLNLYNRKAACDWITRNLTHSGNRLKNAYHLKHVMESDIGLYLFSGEFSGALLACGYKMKLPKERWHHREFYCGFSRECSKRLFEKTNQVI